MVSQKIVPQTNTCGQVDYLRGDFKKTRSGRMDKEERKRVHFCQGDCCCDHSRPRLPENLQVSPQQTHRGFLLSPPSLNPYVTGYMILSCLWVGPGYFRTYPCFTARGWEYSGSERRPFGVFLDCA